MMTRIALYIKLSSTLYTVTIVLILLWNCWHSFVQ